MRMKMQICFFVAAMFLCLSIQAQDTALVDSAYYGRDESGVVYEDAAEYEDTTVIQRFDEDKWHKIIEGINYDKIKEKEEKKAEPTKPKESPPVDFYLLKVIFWIVIIAVAIFLLGLLAKRYYSSPDNVKIKKAEVEVHDFIPENIAELNLDQMLLEALGKGNHKEVIRLYYLIILKELNDKKYIVLKKNSISRDFLNQMSKRKNYLAFRKATILFERVWYGDVDLNENTFPAVENVFKDFVELIRMKKA